MPSLSAPGPRLTVTTPALSGQLLPIACSIRMGEAVHQIATLTVLTPLARDRTLLDSSVSASLVLPEGTPISFIFGSSAADTAIWCGYVSSRQVQHTQTSTTNPMAPVVPVIYTCTGISMPMQSARSRAYTGITASAAARSVIGSYGLGAYITPHPRIFPALAQGAASDFTWLTQLASMIGYRLLVDTDRIAFVPAEIDLTPSTVAVPVFTRAVTPGLYDTLIAFDSTSGQSDPSGSVLTTQRSYAVRPSSGTAASVAASPRIGLGDGTTTTPYFTTIADGSAQSYSDAAYNAVAAAAATRYWVYAQATVDGYTALRPGRTVQLAGSGLSAADQGRWRISTATHSISLSALGRATSTYYAQLELGRDQYADLDVNPPHPPLPRAAAMTSSGGRWISPGAGG